MEAAQSRSSQQPADNDNNKKKNERVCRICLESDDDDDNDDMIAPCLCKGSSKWVHRECLNLWRAQEPARAFSQCTECRFTYHMQQHPIIKEKCRPSRKTRFRCLVFRDLLFVAILSQVLIGIAGAIVWAIDSGGGDDDTIPLQLGASSPVAAYYLCGLGILLVLLGIVGSIVLCRNRCSVSTSMQVLMYHDDEQAAAASSYVTEEQARYYREQRRRRRRQRSHSRHNDECLWVCCHCCSNACYYPNRGVTGAYYYSPSTARSSHDGGGTDSWGNCDWCSCCDGEEGSMCLLGVMLVVLGVMAVLGFFFGIVLAVILFQRVIRRHIHVLQKQQLAQEFQVQDLSSYRDVEKAEPALTDDDESSQRLPKAPPSLASDEALYLRKLGLLQEEPEEEIHLSA